MCTTVMRERQNIQVFAKRRISNSQHYFSELILSWESEPLLVTQTISVEAFSCQTPSALKLCLKLTERPCYPFLGHLHSHMTPLLIFYCFLFSSVLLFFPYVILIEYLSFK